MIIVAIVVVHIDVGTTADWVGAKVISRHPATTNTGSSNCRHPKRQINAHVSRTHVVTI